MARGVARILWIALLFLVAACQPPTVDAPKPRYFQVQLPAAGPGGLVPGQVADVTESIVGVEVGPPNVPAGDGAAAFVAPLADRPKAVVVGWTGGQCDSRFDLELSTGAGGRPTFTLKLLARPGACDLIGVPRRLILTFEGAVTAADFSIEEVR
jgi:hypothetical protein